MSLGETEIREEWSSQELGQEGSSEQRATHGGDVVLSELSGEGGDEWIDLARIREQRIQVVPKASVMARLEPEVPTPGRNDLQKCRCGGQEIPSPAAR